MLSLNNYHYNNLGASWNQNFEGSEADEPCQYCEAIHYGEGRIFLKMNTEENIGICFLNPDA